MKTMVKRSAAVLAVFLVFVLPLPARAGLIDITSLFAFGDSLLDGGNSGLRTQQFTNNPNIVFPPPPYFNGQYSNGPVAVQYLWNRYNPGNPGASRRRWPAAPTTRSVEPPRGRRVSIPSMTAFRIS